MNTSVNSSGRNILSTLLKVVIFWQIRMNLMNQLKLDDLDFVPFLPPHIHVSGIYFRAESSFNDWFSACLHSPETPYISHEHLYTALTKMVYAMFDAFI